MVEAENEFYTTTVTLSQAARLTHSQSFSVVDSLQPTL